MKVLCELPNLFDEKIEVRLITAKSENVLDSVVRVEIKDDSLVRPEGARVLKNF